MTMVVSALAVAFGLPSALSALNGLWMWPYYSPLFLSPDCAEFRILVDFAGGPLAVVLLPLMWLCVWRVIATLPEVGRWVLIAYAVWSTLGGVMFWRTFLL